MCIFIHTFVNKCEYLITQGCPYSQSGVFIHTFVNKCEYLFTLLWISVNIWSQNGVRHRSGRSRLRFFWKVRSKFKNESEKSSILLLSQWLHQDMTQVNGVVPFPSEVDWCPNRRFFIFSPKAKKVRFDVSGSIRPWMEMGPHLWYRQCPHVAIDPIWNRTILGFIFKNELKHFVCTSAPSRHGRPRTRPEPSADTVGPEPAPSREKAIFTKRRLYSHFCE